MENSDVMIYDHRAYAIVLCRTQRVSDLCSGRAVEPPLRTIVGLAAVVCNGYRRGKKLLVELRRLGIRVDMLSSQQQYGIILFTDKGGCIGTTDFCLALN